MKLELRVVMKYLPTYFITILCFLAAIILVSSIPSTFLKQNIGQSIETLKSEGIYPSYGVPWRQVVLDNFTDSLMLNIAYSVDADSPLKSSMINTRYIRASDGSSQIDNLNDFYLEKEVKPAGYERYWHGYLVYLRPLLIFLNYQEIRIILTTLLYLSSILFLSLSWTRLGKINTLATLVGLITVDFFYLGQSIQFSSVFLIGLWGGTYLLLNNDKKTDVGKLFFIIGSLTSFFDLLTAPIISLGIILIVAIALGRTGYKNIVLFCLTWSIGYLLTWATKWVIVQQLFVPGAIGTAFDQVINRTVHQADPDFSRLNAIKLNVFQLIGYNRTNKIINLIIAVGVLPFIFRYLTLNRERIEKAAKWLLIAVIPIAWYLIAANHTYLHVWFTYRNLFLSVVGIILAITECLNWDKLNRDLTRFTSHGRKK